MTTIKSIRDRYGNFIDIEFVNYAGNPAIEINIHEEEFNPCLGVNEIDELIKALQEAKEALENANRDTNE